MKKLLFFIFLCITIFNSLNGAESKQHIKGEIFNEDGQAIIEALVIDTQNPDNPVFTDKEGKFELISSGYSTSLYITKEGYEQQKVDVNFYMNENRTTYVKVVMKPSDAILLDEVVVSDNPSLVSNSYRVLKNQIEQIPGGVNLLNLSKLKTQKSQTLKDALGKVPGVLIQEFFGGNDQPRLNIRGSGIQSNPQARGVMLLQDGIPINLSDGSYILGVLEPQASYLVEVYKGSNALQYGSTTLGGAINFITKNGYNASPFSFKFESGSYKYYNASVSSGFSKNKTDGFLSLSYNQSKGFRELNESNRFNALANIGQRFNQHFESRLLVSYTNMGFDVPGPLTKAQYESNPKQINTKISPQSIGPLVLRDKPKRDSKIFRIANKSVWQINDKSKLQTSLNYQYIDDEFVFPIPEGIRNHQSHNGGLNILYQNTRPKNNLTVGVDVQLGRIHARNYVNYKGEKHGLFADNLLNAYKGMAYINDVWNVHSKLKLNLSVQLNKDIRKGKAAADDPVERPVYSFLNIGNKQGLTYTKSAGIPSKTFQYLGFNPKAGLIYEPNKDIQVFGNFSRSYEPPTFLELVNLEGGTPMSGPTANKFRYLKAQAASTIEMGSRGQALDKRLYWDVSLYRSWVQNELLTLTDLSGFLGQSINSPYATIHQGAEIGLDIIAVQNISKKKDIIRLKTAYTYSDFYFTEGDYKGLQIAGIPTHYLIAEVEYSHPVGLTANFNIESLPVKTPIDHRNELFQDPYTLYNFKVSFQKSSWSVYSEIRNLSNKRYASSYLIRDATELPDLMQVVGATKESATNYIPGIGRNFVVGMSYTF
ncbi:MAG: TonB-dependent receptor [Chitinophagales bacterium]|nr:TonB-dependent receptor [Chitinophagales bacterium]